MQILWGSAQQFNCSRKWLAILALPFLVLTSSCQRRNDKWEPGVDFKTQIIVSKSFGTEFKQVELKGVFDKSTLSGGIVDFYFSPGDQNGRVVGNKPIARFIEDDGVFIPANQITLQMVTLYYHLQQLKELELEASGSNESILSWPRKVALSVRVISNPDMRYDNAFYNGRVDALYFVPYKDSAFPIPLNPGIIGHEHFHSYFNYEVLRPLNAKEILPEQIELRDSLDEKTMKSLYNLYVLKIINEGLADVWGWIYSEDPDFVALSLPKAQQTRNLEKGGNFPTSKVATELDLRTDVYTMYKTCILEKFECHGEDPYSHGTVLARMIKSFTAEYKKSNRTAENETRKLMAGKVLKLIRDIELSFENEKTLTLNQVLVLWEKQFDTLTSEECKVLRDSASNPGDLKCASSAVSPAP